MLVCFISHTHNSLKHFICERLNICALSVLKEKVELYLTTTQLNKNANTPFSTNPDLPYLYHLGFGSKGFTKVMLLFFNQQSMNFAISHIISQLIFLSVIKLFIIL